MAPRRTESESQLDALAAHPILSLEALECPGVRLSRVARIVAYQIHERCNGTGYPRGNQGDEIHPLARIAAVADAYVALVSNRPHRRGMMPYYAMEKMLHGVASGLFDAKAVRGLLHAVSLYPIGSYVRTNAGRIGRVVRSTGETYTKPVIEFWNEKHEQFESDLVDLRSETSIQIAAPSVVP